MTLFLILVIVAIVVIIKYYLPYKKGKDEMKKINTYVENIRKGNDRTYNAQLLGSYFHRLSTINAIATNKITLEQCGYLAESQKEKNRIRANICFALSDRLGGNYVHLYDSEEQKKLCLQLVEECYGKVGFDQAIEVLLELICSMDLSF